jgi:glycosyltransferase involved in cell wall biosynthesis
VAQNYLKQDQLFHQVMHLPCVLAAVSSAVQDILQQEFGRSSLLIPNGIDCERFTPGPWQHSSGSSEAQEQRQQQQLLEEEEEVPAAASLPATETSVVEAQASTAAAVEPMDLEATEAGCAAAAPLGDMGQHAQGAAAAAATTDANKASNGSSGSSAAEGSSLLMTVHPGVAPAAASSLCQGHSPTQHGKKRVLLVGNPALPLKGFPAAIAALAAVSALLPIKVRWVCQVAPTAAHIPQLAAADLDLETVVSPGQAELPGLYRGHDVFLFTSRWVAG